MKAVEDGLRRLDGVDSMHTDLQANLVAITPSADFGLPLAAVPRSIEHSGFRPGRLWIRASGAGEPLPGGASGFRIRNWPQVYALDGAMPAGDGPHEFEVLQSAEGPRLRPVASWPLD